MHPAIITMLAWFFEGGNGARQFMSDFKSSLPDDPIKSKEPEIPASMLMTMVTMVCHPYIILETVETERSY
jgi:hypothetical protein